MKPTGAGAKILCRAVRTPPAQRRKKGKKQQRLNQRAALMKEAEASDGYHWLANLAKEKEKENEKKNEKKKKKNTERDTGIAAAPPRSRFIKPRLEDIQAYCPEKGYCVDPEAI